MWRQALRPIVPRLTPLSTAAAANLMSHLSAHQFTSSTTIAFELLPEDEFQALDEAVQQAEASIPGAKKTKTMHSPHSTPLRPSSSQISGAQPSKPHPASPNTGLLTALSLHPVSLPTLPSADNNSAGAAGNSSKEDSPHPISLASPPSADNSAGAACDSSREDSPRSPLSDTRRNIFLGSPGARRPSKARHIIDNHLAYLPSPGLNDNQSALVSLSRVDEDARLAFSSITADRKTAPGTPSSSRADTDIEDLVQVRGQVSAQVSNLLSRDGAAMEEVASMSVDAIVRVGDSKLGPASWRLEGCSQTSIRAAGPRGMAAGAVASHVRGQQRFGFSSGPRLGGGSAGSSGDDDTQVLSAGEDGNQRETPLQAHRRRRGLSVTDVSSSEWCELQVDFGLREGRPEPTVSMKAGTARHAELEIESLKELEVVEVQVKTREDYWAVRLLNMLSGLHQLKVTGMTRELYVVGEVEGVWMVGMIDELQLGGGEGGTRSRGEAARPLILDTKTRQRPTPPSEAQKLTSRLQLMCYKMLFDGLASGGVTFPYLSFHEHFGLDDTAKLSDDISELAFECGVTEGILQKPSFGDIVRALLSEWRTVQPSQPRLLIRYEWQQDRSLLGQDDFVFDPEWAQARVTRHLEYWKGLREPDPVPPEELWKCRFCAFSDDCPTAQSKNSHS